MNYQSSIGLTEELITNLLNAVAFEYHQRINYEKYYSILNIKGVDTDEERIMYSELLDNAKKMLDLGTKIRRSNMQLLSSISQNENGKDLWCSLKHVAVMTITSFEAWQVDLEDKNLESYYHETVELFNTVISQFLGFAPVPCSACFADMLQNQERLDEIKKNAMKRMEKANESILEGNTDNKKVTTDK